MSVILLQVEKKLKTFHMEDLVLVIKLKQGMKDQQEAPQIKEQLLVIRAVTIDMEEPKELLERLELLDLLELLQLLELEILERVA